MDKQLPRTWPIKATLVLSRRSSTMRTKIPMKLSLPKEVRLRLSRQKRRHFLRKYRWKADCRPFISTSLWEGVPTKSMVRLHSSSVGGAHAPIPAPASKLNHDLKLLRSPFSELAPVKAQNRTNWRVFKWARKPRMQSGSERQRMLIGQRGKKNKRSTLLSKPLIGRRPRKGSLSWIFVDWYWFAATTPSLLHVPEVSAVLASPHALILQSLHHRPA